MKHLIFATDKEKPSEDDNSSYGKFYRKHDFSEIFESHLAWGPNNLEIHCHLSPAGRKLIVDKMYYLVFEDGELVKEKGSRENLEMLCTVFKLPIKPKGK